MHGGLLGKRAEPVEPIEGRAEQRGVVPVAGATTVPSGMPVPSVAVERFSPPLRRSTGLGPEHSPPDSALV